MASQEELAQMGLLEGASGEKEGPVVCPTGLQHPTGGPASVHGSGSCGPDTPAYAAASKCALI